MQIMLAALVAVGLSLTTAAVPPLLADARQLIVVTTPDWNTMRGELRRYERVTPTAQWKAVGAPIAMVVGRNGLAWDPLADPIPGHPRQLRIPIGTAGEMATFWQVWDRMPGGPMLM